MKQLKVLDARKVSDEERRQVVTQLHKTDFLV